MAIELENPATSDSVEAFESKETANRLPIGWLALLVGLVLWGLYYVYAFNPSLGGWSQSAEYQQSVEGTGR